MLHIFIILILCLLIYQLYYIFSIEGLTDNDKNNTDEPVSDTTQPTPTTNTTMSTSPVEDDKNSPPPPPPPPSTESPDSKSNMDLSKMTKGYNTVSLTDRNLLFLNDRVNVLNNNYMDLSMNLVKLQNQLKENAVKSESEATDLVGNTPIKVT